MRRTYRRRSEPGKGSSASQFYIVTGKKYSEQELNQMEKQLEGRLKQEIFARLQNENKPKIMEFYRSGNKEDWRSFVIP